MSITYLKVKIKSLAEEARIIRKEERRALRKASYHRNKQNQEATDAAYSLYCNLQLHRHHPVGTESRAALIAYGFINGLPYSKVENPSSKNALRFLKSCVYLSATEIARYAAMKKPLPQEYIDNITKRAYTLINKYGRKITFEEFEKWIEGR